MSGFPPPGPAPGVSQHHQGLIRWQGLPHSKDHLLPGPDEVPTLQPESGERCLSRLPPISGSVYTLLSLPLFPLGALALRG